jgi:glycine oxidase
VRIIVIGAGIIGAAVSEALAQRGAEVTILEMRGPGRGASQASAGMLAPYTEATDHRPLLDLGIRSLDLFDALVMRLTERTRRPIEYRRSGTLEVGFDDNECARLHALIPTLFELGVTAEWWSPPELFTREPALARSARAGLFVPAHGFVGVSDLVSALLESARWACATLVSPVEAASVEEGRDAVTVRMGDTRFDADRVVVAAGPWTGRVRIAHVRPLPVKPVRGQLLHLMAPPEARPERIVWGPRCYAVPWTDGSLLVGATVEDAGFDEHATVEGVQVLTRAIAELVPVTSRARLEAVRVGLRPALPDHLPAVGPFEAAPRVVAATGHYRNGVLLAPLTATVVSRYVLDGVIDPSFDVTSPDRKWGDHDIK